MQFDIWWWLFFNLAVVVFLLIDIALLRNQKISSRKALALTAMWVTVALLFSWLRRSGKCRPSHSGMGKLSAREMVFRIRPDTTPTYRTERNQPAGWDEPAA